MIKHYGLEIFYNRQSVIRATCEETSQISAHLYIATNNFMYLRFSLAHQGSVKDVYINNLNAGDILQFVAITEKKASGDSPLKTASTIGHALEQYPVTPSAPGNQHGLAITLKEEKKSKHYSHPLNGGISLFIAGSSKNQFKLTSMTGNDDESYREDITTLNAHETFTSEIIETPIIKPMSPSDENDCAHTPQQNSETKPYLDPKTLGDVFISSNYQQKPA